eukprot:8273345-Pyramimonas_sp.AAC.1
MSAMSKRSADGSSLSNRFRGGSRSFTLRLRMYPFDALALSKWGPPPTMIVERMSSLVTSIVHSHRVRTSSHVKARRIHWWPANVIPANLGEQKSR